MKGRSIPLTPHRRIVIDMLREASRIPTVPVQRVMCIRDLVEARAKQPRPHVSWTALFTWAMARVCLEMPVLRRVYLKYPWPRLYEYPGSVAAIALEAEQAGEPVVVFHTIRQPETLSLMEIDEFVRRRKALPPEKNLELRRLVALARWPVLVRRLVYLVGLNWGRQRAKYFGTFGVTSYAALGAESLHPLSPATVTLTYGKIEDCGTVTARMIYDHRVTDGAVIARALVLLEEYLNLAAQQCVACPEFAEQVELCPN